MTAAAVSMAILSGCSGSQTAATTAAETTTVAETTAEETTAEATEAEEEDEENYDTGDASMDNTRNQDEIGENELLVVSFGTSYNDSRRLTVGAIENAIETAFPDYSVRRGFTSQIIIDHVKKRDNVAIDNVAEALNRAIDNGVKNLVVQPTHLMNGLEYTDLVNELAENSDAFEHVAVGEPLLTSDDDFKAVISAITDATKEYDLHQCQNFFRIILSKTGTSAAPDTICLHHSVLLSVSGPAPLRYHLWLYPQWNLRC